MVRTHRTLLSGVVAGEKHWSTQDIAHVCAVLFLLLLGPRVGGGKNKMLGQCPVSSIVLFCPALTPGLLSNVLCVLTI